ncbi:phosphatidylglycerophosphatase [Mobiluncus mulieris]|nr:phosphatidylglycerophosphatase [Mobiluncus mulieris]MCV0011413.1 phosphatidylglycerophosphatase [Mobiluncus mulieris]PNL42817.1 phosphatidylglycerophosphatase [Mobiluncus mulieris]
MVANPGFSGFSGVSGVFGWGLVVISGFFGTGWPIWLQVWLLFPEIATIPPPKP